MEIINGHNISNLPINGLQKVFDILEYDGPILSHFKDAKEQNYFFYWVDFNENCNRWLVWKTNEKQIYDYLKGALSLQHILLSEIKDYIFSVDIDRQLNYNAVYSIDIDCIPNEYIPEESSFFKLAVPEFYKSLIESFELNPYLITLREKALYFKLEPITKSYLSAVTAFDAGVFLKKIAESFLGFVEEDFFQSFKYEISDFDRLKKIISQFKEVLSPRIVELEYSSFKVAISTDQLQQVESDKYKTWQKNILEKYRYEVVDIDYTSDDSLNIIAERYSEDARRKIFAPYLDLLNDKNIKIEVTDFKKTFKRQYHSMSKEKQKIIIPQRDISLKETEKKKLYSVVIELTEGQDISKISKRNLQSGLLFSEEVSEANININHIHIDDTIINLKKPLSLALKNDNSIYHAENKEFGIVVDSESKLTLYDKIYREFIRQYRLSDNNIEMRNKFEDIIFSFNQENEPN